MLKKRMQKKALFALFAIVLCFTLSGVSQAAEKRHERTGSEGKWMTGDFHQHTTFTDGSYPMNDLTAPGGIATEAIMDPTGLFRKGVMPQGFRFGLDFQANSEHGGIRNRDGFGNAWNTYSPSPVIGDGASGNANEHVALAVPDQPPGYTGLQRPRLHGSL